MQNQFTPDADDQSSQKKRSQQRLLLLLLLLMGLFAYLYFFTGLIKPRPEQTAEQPPQPVASATVVKQPLPPRQQNVSTATVATGAATTAGVQQPAAAAPQPQAAAKPAPGAAAPAAKPAPAAPAAQPAKPAPAAQKKADKPAAPAVNGAKAAKPVAAKEAKPAAAKEAKHAAAKEAKHAAAKEAKHAAAKPAAAKVKPAAAKEAKPAAAAGTKAVTKPAVTAKVDNGAAKGKPQAKSVAGSYALEMKDDLAQSEIGTVTAKLKKAGLGNVVQTKAQKGEEMHRLYLADFANRDEAAEQLQRLKDVAPNAFMLKENGRYAVYAGSFLREGKAATEQDRLYDKGVRLLLKTATAQVPVVKLRAGSFADQASAQKAAANLKKSGLTAQVVKVGK